MSIDAKVLIVEDDVLLAKKYKSYLTESNYEVTEIVRNAGDAMLSVASNEPDVIILDIELEGKTDGIVLAKNISKIYKIPFIYVTGYEQKRKKAWETLPLYFILKPIDKKQLITCVEYALFLHDTSDTQKNNRKASRLYIKSKDSIDRVDLDKILYIQAASGCSLIFIDKNINICYTKNIQVLDAILCGNHFMRVHRSYIVNMEQVDSFITGENLLIVKGVEIPVGKTYIKLVKKYFDDNSLL